MQVNNIRSNNISFGAKLVIDDYQGVLKGAKRISEHSLDKVRAFSEQELKQIETSFEQRTKNSDGKMELVTGYLSHIDRSSRKVTPAECSLLYYHPSEPEASEPLRSSDITKLLYPNAECAKIKFIDNMPASVNEFVDKLVGAFIALENRYTQTKEIRSLKNTIETLTTKSEDGLLSEISKYFKINKAVYTYAGK